MYIGTSNSRHPAIPGSQLSADWSAELVHFSDAVQPHGALLVLSQPDLKILQVSANSQPHFGIQPDALLGQSLAALLQQPSVDLVRQSLPVEDVVSLQLTLQSGGLFHATLYSHEGGLLLELEPADAHASFSLLTLHGRVKRAIAQLRQTSTLRDFFQRTADEVRQITGFDRVLIYQFDVQGSGEVIAESKGEELPSYLGLHYPATDIPEPVRNLYAGGLVRAIPDFTAGPVNLVPAQNPITQQPLNLNRLVLRGVDPCCITFHQNMGVSALLVISLLKDKTLWGLISCHHRTPKPIPYEVREACELLGHFMASELANKVDHEELDYILKLRTLQSEFVESIAELENLREALVNPAPRLLQLVNAEGAAVCLENDITLVGETPNVEQVRDLIEWADPQVQDSLFQTAALPKEYPPAQEFQAIASGLLLLRIAKIQRYYILWFRPEVLQTVTWAGDPHHAVRVTETGGDRILSPRQSFEHWQEIVRATALPWKACELDNAMDLRNAIVGIVLKKADELTRINQELERSNRELDSFAFAASHDLKEPLRGIHNFSHLLIKDYAAALDETGNSRLHTLIRLSRRMETLIDSLLKFSRLGQTSLQLQPTDLNLLVAGVLEDLGTRSQGIPSEIRIPRSLPTIACDPVLVNELFTNLISNALKYTDKSHPWIEIGWVEDGPENTPTLYIRDNGIGIRQRHYETVFRLFKRLHEQNLYGGGTGAGLAIAKKIVERHGGRIWVESAYGEGSSFYFRLGSSAV